MVEVSESVDSLCDAGACGADAVLPGASRRVGWTKTEQALLDAMNGRRSLDELAAAVGMTGYRGLSGPDLVRPFEEDPAWQ